MAMEIDPELKKKIEDAREALKKHHDFLPGAIYVFGEMMTATILSGNVPSEGLLGAIFATVPAEDIAKVSAALEGVKAQRDVIISTPKPPSG